MSEVITHGSLFSGNKYEYKCNVCDNLFKSYNKNPRYCSLKCRVKSMTTNIDFTVIKNLYEKGLTQSEIADKLNTTQKVIYSIFKRNKYKCRVAKKRNQYKENNSSWVGNNAVYATIHKRIEVLYGKPCKCEICGCIKPNIRYEWANITGDYFDIKNGYKRMCVSCHRKFDKSEKGIKNNVKRTKK
jgi:predicted DNA-binding protein YlxM (UPF0122 family)